MTRGYKRSATTIFLLIGQMGCATYDTVNGEKDFAQTLKELTDAGNIASRDELANSANICSERIKSLAEQASGRERTAVWLTVFGVINGVLGAVFAAAAPSAGNTAEKTWYAIGAAGTAAAGAGLITLTKAFSPTDAAQKHGEAHGDYLTALGALANPTLATRAGSAIVALQKCMGVASASSISKAQEVNQNMPQQKKDSILEQLK